MRKCRDFQKTIAPLHPTADTDALIAGVKSGALKSKSVDGYLVLAGEFYDQIEAGTKVEKVAFQDAANNECDPLAIPDGFVPVRIAIHLGKRL